MSKKTKRDSARKVVPVLGGKKKDRDSACLQCVHYKMYQQGKRLWCECVLDMPLHKPECYAYKCRPKPLTVRDAT